MRNRSMKSFVAVGLTLAVGLCSTALAEPSLSPTGPNGRNPPVFVGLPTELVVDISGPGLETFDISGMVTDADPMDTVRVDISNNAGFMRFFSTPGNPATFRFYSTPLTYREYGTLFVVFDALDNSSPFPLGTLRGLTLRIVPEPVGLLVVGAIAAVGLRRSRRPGLIRATAGREMFAATSPAA